jgi:hypothetical protein
MGDEDDGCLVNSIFMHRGTPGEHESSVADFAQEVLKGQLPLSVRFCCKNCFSCGDDVKRVDPVGGLVRRPGHRTVRSP